MLLQILQPELESPANADAAQGADGERDPGDKITVITRRIVPALRQYSTWLVANATIIVMTGGASSTNVHIKEMWKMYADVLTRLINFFPVTKLPKTPYLLEEDEMTLGFKPLRDQILAPRCTLYTDDTKKLKPRMNDPGVERSHPNLEMLGRVFDILLCGVEINSNDEYPIMYDAQSEVFTYLEEGIPVASPINSQVPNASSQQQYTSSDLGVSEVAQSHGRRPAPDESVAASDSNQTMDTDMYNMVDSLVEPSKAQAPIGNDTSYGMHSATANEIYATAMATSNGLYPRQGTPKILPSLPGFSNSPFTPQPNELQAPSPDRPTTARQQFSPRPAASADPRTTPASPNTPIGYGSSSRGSWGTAAGGSGSGSGQEVRPVNQMLQEAMTSQYMPGSGMSSAFPDSSSLYASHSPHFESRLKNGTRNMTVPTTNGNKSTVYSAGSDYDRRTMLQSSLWNGSQPIWAAGSAETPPGGQGG